MKALLIGSLLAAMTAGHAMSQEPLPDAVLEQARGGMLSIDGLKFDFAAVAKTFADGMLALQTKVTWTPQGPVVVRDGNAASGGADFRHDVVGGELRSLIVNTDSGRTLRQETDVTLVLPGFATTQGDMSRSLFGLRLGDDISSSAIKAASGN